MNISKLILSLGFTNWILLAIKAYLVSRTSIAIGVKKDILDMISTSLSYYLWFFSGIVALICLLLSKRVEKKYKLISILSNFIYLCLHILWWIFVRYMSMYG